MNWIQKIHLDWNCQPTWKQQKCPLIDHGVKRRQYIHTMEYRSAIKKDEIVPSVITWMNVENIMLSKISETESQESYDFTHMWDIQLEATNEQTRQINKNS